jgi:hypothetical protein
MYTVCSSLIIVPRKNISLRCTFDNAHVHVNVNVNFNVPMPAVRTFTRPCCMSMSVLHVHVNAACSYLHTVSMLRVYAARPCRMSMLNVCTCCMFMLRISCCMSFLHVHAACLCCKSLLNVHAAFSLAAFLLLHSPSCPCRM